jgi:N-acetylglucosamine-6-phosphate deacetylase
VSLLLAGVLARQGRSAEGWIEIEGERVSAAGGGPPPREADELCLGILAPGLVDLQVNGAAGHQVSDGAAAIAAIDAIQLAHGVTSYLPTLLSPNDERAPAILDQLSQFADDPRSPVVGVHVEGPFLHPAQRGMHQLGQLRSLAEGVPSWLDHEVVTLVTIAPELPGALSLIKRLCNRGKTVALGHSTAAARTAELAFDAGATMVTHAFNAMEPLHHRAPGLLGAALVDPRVHVTVIADGVHVDPRMLEVLRRVAGPRVVLVSDASPAAGAPPGSHLMAATPIRSFDGGEVRTLDGRLAGSSLTLDAAMRCWAKSTSASLPEALAAASETPARAVGLEPSLAPGSRADLLLIAEDGSIRRVMRAGRWLDEQGTGRRSASRAPVRPQPPAD